ncbi:MAG TPA: hypothetical protein VGR47_05605 [Terracidiphilus sp.]|nr:hypothetical protein [Terracidiphilus sp.]
MARREFHLDITDQSVNVRLDAGRTRFFALAFFASLTALAICALLFLPGKNDTPSMWDGGLVGLLFLLLGFPLFMLFTTKRYVMLAFPSDETFHCDRSSLSISRARWLDVHNEHWNTRSFSLVEVEEITYGKVVTLRGYSIDGIRFVSGGTTYRVLPGIKPRDAQSLLTALKKFGADVPDDPELARKLEDDVFA